MHFENAGREITQSFEVMHSNTALATGTLAALLGFLGAGELFGTRSQPEGGIPRLSSTSLLVLSAAIPLIWRFFVRSLTAYENLLRFNAVQREASTYLAGESSWMAFKTHNEIFWRFWKAPRPLWKLLWHNLQYGFLWIFALSASLLTWAFITAEGTLPRVVAGVILVLAGLAEALSMRAYRKNTVRQPNEEDWEALRRARLEPYEATSQGAVRPRGFGVLFKVRGWLEPNRRHQD